MTAPAAAPARRTCPACARRYAALVDPDCLVCDGHGVLVLGAAALHTHPAPVVARAVELYLEARAQPAVARGTSYAERRPTLEGALAELRHAGVLASGPHAGAPARDRAPGDAASARVAELEAHRLTRSLGASPNTGSLEALRPRRPLEPMSSRPARGAVPIASAGGSVSAVARIADPLDPLGRDSELLDRERRATERAATALAHATPEAARRRTRRTGAHQ